MIEVLCGFLASGPIAGELLRMYPPCLDNTKRRISHFFLALNIDSFLSPEAFKSRLQDLVRAVRRKKPANSELPVLVPGDPEKFHFQIRSKDGIPVDEEKVAELENLLPGFSFGGQS
jgi:LDH2 family malate/lactate/ureidoglycolate dehydrogenase